MSRRLAALTATLTCTAVLTLSGCGALSRGAYDVTLPGGADVGDSPLTVTAEFTDVLDLVPQSAVKVADVAIGRVENITLDKGGRSAQVEMVIRDGLKLPVGTTARIQQTSLLGEKYVDLVRPGDAPDDGGVTVPDDGVAVPVTDVGTATAQGPYLEDGADIPLSSTSQAVGVEQVLGALSLLLSGGGLGQFQEISRELQKVSTGRPDQIRAFLEQTRTLTTTLDSRRDSITDAIDGLATLSDTLNGERPKIARALDGLEPGLAVLRDQRTQLVDMLESLDKLSTVSVRTLDKAQDDIVADFKKLDPILSNLARSGDSFPQALQVLFTYPFPDSVLGAIRGDYLNVFATMNLTTPGQCTLQSEDPDLVKQPTGRVELTAGGTCQRVGETSGAGGAGGSAGLSQNLMLLPPTSSAVPGLDSPTVTSSPSGVLSPGGAAPSSSGSQSAKPSGQASTSSGSPSDGGSSSTTSPSPASGSSSAPSSPSGSAGSSSPTRSPGTKAPSTSPTSKNPSSGAPAATPSTSSPSASQSSPRQPSQSGAR